METRGSRDAFRIIQRSEVTEVSENRCLILKAPESVRVYSADAAGEPKGASGNPNRVFKKWSGREENRNS